MRPMGCCGAGLAGQAVEWEIGCISTCSGSHSCRFKLSLAPPVDADYVALRPILYINKVLVNLQ